MKIALINEASESDKNQLLYDILSEVAKKYGHTVRNYGMYSTEPLPDSQIDPTDKILKPTLYRRSQDQPQLNSLHNALISGILINTKAADLIISGCGNGQGVMVALNSYPGVICGHVVDPVDGYMFGKVNNGNAVALQLDKQFGWGAEINLKLIFEQILSIKWGSGYPEFNVESEQWEQNTLRSIKKITHYDMVYILHHLDKDFIDVALSGKHFSEYFLADAEEGTLKDTVKEELNRIDKNNNVVS